MLTCATPSSRTRVLAAWGFAALSAALAGVLSGCQRDDGAEAETPPAVAPIPVVGQVLQTGPIQAAVEAWATLRPHRSAEIRAELTGRVTRVHAGLGGRVSSGQVILEIDPELYAARAEEAESNLTSSAAALERAEKELGRREALGEQGVAAESEVERARTEAAAARAAHAAAAATLAEARKQLREARLVAPFAGTVATRPPDPGSTVTPGTLLVTLVDVSRLVADALVSEQDLRRIRPGEGAALAVSGLPGRTFAGTVVSVGPQAEAQSRQFPVEVEVRNSEDLPLKGGMVARVEFIYESRDDLPLLPVDALLEEGGELYFYVLRGTTALRRVLVPGPREGEWVAALEGAAPGDTVVVQGQTRLADGAPVTVETVR